MSKLGYDQLAYNVRVWEWGSKNGHKTIYTRPKPKVVIPRSVILKQIVEKLEVMEDKTDFIYNYISLRN